MAGMDSCCEGALLYFSAVHGRPSVVSADLKACYDGPMVAVAQLAAVIDFGTCGVGDPACDLAIAWTLLTAEGRQRFRERLPAGPAEWARGRGWALWKTLTTCANTLHDDDEETANARRVLSEIFSEYTVGSRPAYRASGSP